MYFHRRNGKYYLHIIFKRVDIAHFINETSAKTVCHVILNINEDSDNNNNYYYYRVRRGGVASWNERAKIMRDSANFGLGAVAHGFNIFSGSVASSDESFNIVATYLRQNPDFIR